MVNSLPFHVYPEDAYSYFRSSLNLDEENLRKFLVTQAKECWARRESWEEERNRRNYQTIIDLSTTDLDKFRLYIVDILTTCYVEPDVFDNYFIVKQGCTATTLITLEMYIDFLKFLDFTLEEITTLKPYLPQDYGTVENFM